MAPAGGIGERYATQVGALQMPPDTCCDMSGCIALFERIDVDVTRIETMAGSKPDMIYRRTSEGWRADMPRVVVARAF